MKKIVASILFIYHESVELTEDGKGIGKLNTTASWKDNKGNKLLDEMSEFTFMSQAKTHIIDRTTRLKAVNGPVKMTINKEGMFAIRVTRELELPASRKVKLSDSHGNVTEVDLSDNETARRTGKRFKNKL